MKVMILGIDGYLGWSLGLWLGSLGYKVSGIDNFLRRDCVAEKGAHTVVPIARMTRRLKKVNEVLGSNINFRKFDVLDKNKLREFLDEVKPDTIIHYAENPSAPYSMVDDDHAISVQANNVMGTLRLLYAMKDIVPYANLIKLGTMGEYGTPLTGRPIFEGLFPADAVLKWGDREWSLAGEMVPRDPGSFYHVSKVQDTYNVFEACKYWWLRSYDIMQGVIFGVHLPQFKDDEIRTRFDVDEWFGTVINRFVAQAIVNIPLTIYGSGHQRRGFLALQDAMQCMTRLINSPPPPGVYDVVNQLSGIYSVLELAKTVARIGKDKFGLDIKVQRLSNPRVEADEHPYHVEYKNLPEKFGFKPQIELEEEVHKMYELLLKPEIKSRIQEKKHVIMPKTHWSGEKKNTQVMEVIEY
jgi:UDP-sulfoquinovose synthase